MNEEKSRQLRKMIQESGGYYKIQFTITIKKAPYRGLFHKY